MLPRRRSCREQLAAIMAEDANIENDARLCRPIEPHRRKLLVMATRARFREHPAPSADLTAEMLFECRLSTGAQLPGALFRDRAKQLRHSCRRRAGTRREGKDVKTGEAAGINEVERAREHRIRFGRKAGDHVRAEDHVGAEPPHLRAERDCVRTAMPPLHALEDEIISGLQGKVQMRHEPCLRRKRIHEITIRLD